MIVLLKTKHRIKLKKKGKEIPKGTGILAYYSIELLISQYLPEEKKQKNQGQNAKELSRKRKKMGAWMKNLTKLSTAGKKCAIIK